MTKLNTDKIPQGLLLVFLGAFPVAVLYGLIFPFPVPMGGPRVGIRAVPAFLFAVFFYEIAGGFLVLIPMGVIAALASKTKASLVFNCLFADLVAVVMVANLHLIVGPW